MLTFVYLLALLPSTACAHRNWNTSNWVAKCSAKGGFPGSVMGTDPWGAVMKPSDADMSAIMSEACGMPAEYVFMPCQIRCSPSHSQPKRSILFCRSLFSAACRVPVLDLPNLVHGLSYPTSRVAFNFLGSRYFRFHSYFRLNSACRGADFAFS